MPYQPTLEQYEIIYNNASNAIFLIGVEGPGIYRILSVNAVYLRWNSLKPEQIVGKLVSDYYGPEGLEHIRFRYQTAIDNRTPYRYLVPQNVVGEGQHIQTTLVPVFDESETCTHIIGVVRNVTRATQEAQKLEAEKQRAENYLDIAAALIVAIDLDGCITLLNRKGYELLGYESGSLIGKCWFDEISEAKDRQAHNEQFRQFVASKGPNGQSTSSVQTATGELRRIKMHHTLLFDEAGEVSGMLSSGEDITDIERAQKSLIVSQRLMAAEEVVMAAAHDFNNSLQAIMGNIEIALDHSKLSPEIEAYLRSSIRLAEDAGSRIQSLNRSAELNPGQDYKPVNINQLVRDVVDETRYFWDGMSAKNVAVNLDVQLDPAVGSSPGNAADLRTVLFNIIKNAIEAVEQAGEISIRTSNTPNSNLIEIADNGVGMDPDTQTRVFQPFFSTKGYESGRGIGMSSARNIVKAHDGDIEVTATAPGIGTTIQITLPVAQTSTIAVSPVSDTAVSHSILWVDDDERIQELAKGYIDALGHEGEIAGSGREALEIVSKGQFSVLVTDLGMPEMSGFDLARQVREISADIPVVALTGWGDNLLGTDQIGNGISEVVGKPIRLETLKAVLARYPGIPRRADS